MPVDRDVRAAAAGSEEGSATGTESRAARADVDEEHAGEWRGPRSCPKSTISRSFRSRSRFSAAATSSSPREREGVGVVDGGASQRGHDEDGTARPCRTRCNCSARPSTPTSRAKPGPSTFVSTAAKFGATLDVLADMLLNSTFPSAGLERLRGQRLVALTQARAQPGAIAGRVFPRIVFGDEPSVRPCRDGAVAEGHHSRRYRRVPQGVLPAGARAHHRRRRHHAGDGEAGDREGACRMGQGRGASDLQLPGGRRAAADHDLSRRQAWRGAVDLRDRPPGSASQHARLLRAPGHEHDSRRHVPVAAQREHPRGERLQLRRQLELRLRQGARRLPRRRRHRHGQERRRARRVHEGAAWHARRAAASPTTS